MVEDRLQRRLAAILAADVVGYSRLMELDEVGTLSALKARRKEIVSPLVAKHQGRVFKVTGDGIMVEFGSAVNAVQCAIDMQQAMAAAAAGSRRTAASCCASASISATSWWSAAISMATASTSPRAWRPPRIRAASTSPARPSTRSATSSRPPSRNWASRAQEHRRAGARLSGLGARAPADRGRCRRPAASHPSPSCLSTA